MYAKAYVIFTFQPKITQLLKVIHWATWRGLIEHCRYTGLLFISVMLNSGKLRRSITSFDGGFNHMSQWCKMWWQSEQQLFVDRSNRYQVMGYVMGFLVLYRITAYTSNLPWFSTNQCVFRFKSSLLFVICDWWVPVVYLSLFL